MKCPECNGSGSIVWDDDTEPCPFCGGTGDSENPARIHQPSKADCECTNCQYHTEERAKGN